MSSVFLVVMGVSLVGVLVVAFAGAVHHSTRMERQAQGRMLPHEEEAYLLIKEVKRAAG